MKSERAQIIALYICAAVILLAPPLVALAAMFVLAAVLELVTAMWSQILMRRPRVARSPGVWMAVATTICAIIIRSVIIARGLS